MLVSICMVTYNGAKYIREQVDSILNQEFKENPDVELELVTYLSVIWRSWVR